MFDISTKDFHTAHTTNVVPFVFIGRNADIAGIGVGALCDVAPSILTIMGLPIPDDMTGKSLITLK